MRIRESSATITQSLACAFAVVVVASALPFAPSNAAAPNEAPPYWAFAINLPMPTPGTATPTRSVDEAARRLPGSAMAFTPAQLDDLFGVPDWHPETHRPMPNIVMHGRRPTVFACGYCHLPNGQGRPENASLAGLPVDYIVQQLSDFKSGKRKSSQPLHVPTALMISAETQASEPEIREAAAYFSSLRPKKWIRVVETKTVSKTHVSGWMLVASEPDTQEPIGQRIIETPENLQRTELRDDTSGFVAYVPIGSLKRGELFVNFGNAGQSDACVSCHGPKLRGVGNIPSLAGRSPSYLVRQLYDIQHGTRAGLAAQQMIAPVQKLTIADMLSIAAYAASITP